MVVIGADHSSTDVACCVIDSSEKLCLSVISEKGPRVCLWSVVQVHMAEVCQVSNLSEMRIRLQVICCALIIMKSHRTVRQGVSVAKPKQLIGKRLKWLTTRKSACFFKSVYKSIRADGLLRLWSIASRLHALQASNSGSVCMRTLCKVVLTSDAESGLTGR